MPYAYQGDYYQGDYYQGDPGLGSLLKKALHVAAPVLLTPFLGPVAGLVSGPGGKLAGKIFKAGAAVLPGPLGAGARVAVGPQVALGEHIGMALSPKQQVEMAMATPPGAMVSVMGPGGQLMHVRRTHLNKATYYRRGGGTQNFMPGLVLKGTEFVPNRRHNPANPRALRRALSRIQGFGKIVKRMKRAVARANSAVGNVHRGRKAVARRR